MKIIDQIKNLFKKNKVTNPTTSPKSNPAQHLPSNLVWDASHDKLYCKPCYPAHTVPLWFGVADVKFFDDENIKSFIKAHSHCSEHCLEKV